MSPSGPASPGPRLAPRLAGALVVAGICLAPPLHAEDTTAAAVGDAPAPVTLLRPANGASLPSGQRGAKVGLAWQRLHELPIWYFIEVLASGPGDAREVFTGYTRQAQLRVRLDGAGVYEWRVVAVNRTSAHYSVSPWRSFTVEGVSEAKR